MIALDGMPGAGKTTLLHHLRDALPSRVMIYPEAQPPPSPRSDAETTQSLLAEARRRLDTSRRARRHRRDLIVVSDRCHIGVLAYRYARMTAGQGSTGDFHHALHLADQLGLTAPSAHDHILVLVTDPAESTARRSAYAHDPRYRIWFDPDFLAAYHHFLTHLTDWLPAGGFTLHDTTTDSAWPALISTLPPSLTASLTARFGKRPAIAPVEAS